MTRDRSGPRRLAAALTGVALASCILPSEPSDAERISFELTFGSPLRVPLDRAIRPAITVMSNGRPLRAPTYRLESLGPGIVRIDGTGHGLIGTARGATSVRIVYTGTTGTVDSTFPVRAVVSDVRVEPSGITLRRLGDTVRMRAVADSLLQFPPTAFMWSSSNSAIATVSATGLVTAVHDGAVRIIAELDEVEGGAPLAVLQAAATVRVLPEHDTLHTLGRTTRFIAVALDSAGSVLAGAKPRWTSLNPAVAVVDSTGLATAVHGGTATIVGTVGLAADTATLLVKQVVRALFLTPSLDTLTAIDDTGRIVVSAADSAGEPIPPEDFVIDSWTSGDPAIATVDASGLVTAHANGVVLITATSGTESAFSTFVVRQEVAEVRLDQEDVSLSGAGTTAQLSGAALDKNGYLVPGAGDFEWRSHFALVATVDATGLVTAQGNGRTLVRASLAGHSDSVTVTVTDAPQDLIAFNSDSGIEAMRTDGSLRTVLIPNVTCDYGCGASYSDPAWSPDGTRLAYGAAVYDNGTCYYGCLDIYTSRPDGSDARNLTQNDGYTYSSDPAWSPEGTLIAFAHGMPRIYVMNADGSNPRQVTSSGGRNPKWSADGQRIVYEDAGDILIVNADGTGRVKVTNDAAADAHPAWSPDGTQIAFTSDRAGDNDIWLTNVDGSGAVNLTGGLTFPGSPERSREVTPAWSPEGSRVTFASAACSTVTDDYYGYTNVVCQAPTLYIVNRDGSNLVALTAEGVNPAWHAAGSISPASAPAPVPAARIRR